MFTRLIARTHWTHVAGAIMGAYLAAFIPLMVLSTGTGNPPLAYGMAVLLPCVVATFCVVAARAAKTARIRWFWWLLAIGHVLSGLGDIAWAHYELILQIEKPAPFIGDVGYLAYYPVAFAACLMLVSFRGRSKAAVASLVLDALLFAIPAGTLCWLLIIAPNYDPSAGILTSLAKVFYAAGDMLLLVGVFSLFLLAGARLRPRGLGWLCASFVAWFSADTSRALTSAEETFATSSWTGLVWPVAYVFVGIAALSFVKTAAGSKSTASGELPGPRSQTAARVIQLVLPYAVFPGIVALVAIRFLAMPEGGRAGDVATIGVAVLLTVMVLVRQIVVFVENRRLQASLERLSRDLEMRVVQRTEELAAEKEHLAMLNGVADQMSQCVTARDVIHSGLLLATTMSGSPRTGVWLARSGGRPQFFGDAGLSRAGRLQMLAVLQNSDSVARIQTEGGAARVENTELRACLAGRGLQEVFQTVVTLPLISRRSVLGMMCLGYADSADRPDEDDTALAHAVASQVAVALENARRYDDARRMAEQDPVTGLLNSRGTAKALDHELARSRRGGAVFSVAVLDLDRFKVFNDTYGHAMGDQVLREVATALRRVLRRSDIIGRQGGDEFMVILPDTTGENAVECVKHVQQALRATGFSTEEGRLPIPMSCGLATYPDDGRRVGELLAVADANVYRSKQRGGDCVTPDVRAHGDEESETGVFTVLESLVAAVDKKDHYSKRHSHDVTHYAMELAKWLNLSSESLRPLRIAAVLHDVGRIGVPDSILLKPGPLTSAEYDIVKQHVSLGEQMIEEMPDLAEVLAAVGSHHERWDGTGYPRGLAGEAIPFLGRILAVADAYSAMTTDRVHRKALGSADAVAEMRRVGGGQLDPHLVKVFLVGLAQSGPGGQRAGEDLGAGSVSCDAA